MSEDPYQEKAIPLQVGSQDWQEGSPQTAGPPRANNPCRLWPSVGMVGWSVMLPTLLALALGHLD
jgi:hypothetical protein